MAARVFNGRIHKGKVEFDQPLPLPEGADIKIVAGSTTNIVLPELPDTNEGSSTFYDDFAEFISSWEDVPKDLSANKNHYLYGADKDA